jgi:LuxR family transcriptional regulator, maltose regulon positive regulatory protein
VIRPGRWSRAAQAARRGPAHRPGSRRRPARLPSPLQRAFGPGQPARDSVPPGIVDPLTSRELEVLKMLAAGRSNQAIARELVVTLDTVKKHVGHVMGKLGAANRTEAVARARELS